MTPIILIHELAKEISAVVKNYTFIAELQNPKPVTVYEQYLPTDRFEDDTFYPLVIVSCRQVEVLDKQFRRATLILTLGVYGGDKDEGWRDLFNMAERITQFLITTPIIGNKFPLDTAPTFEPLSEQPEPFFFGNILVRYQIPTPQI